MVVPLPSLHIPVGGTRFVWQLLLPHSADWLGPLLPVVLPGSRSTLSACPLLLTAVPRLRFDSLFFLNGLVVHYAQ